MTQPVFCKNTSAWLGEGYYFWYYEADAIFWGKTAKRRSGSFEVYKAQIALDDVLNTVFNEEHYNFWVEQIEKAAKKFVKLTGLKPTLKELNDYFKDKGAWESIDGIIFQDISRNPDHFIVKEFQYKKRIQIAVYNLEIVKDFLFNFEMEA